MADSENGYTSEQCKYRLYKMLQRSFSLEKERDRYYTRDFFYKLLEGVEVTVDAYQKFVEVLEDDLDYCARKGINKADDVTQEIIDEKKGTLVSAFENIGIDLVVERQSYSGSLTFTKPDGTVMIYHMNDGTNDFYINAVSGQEIGYAKLSSPYFLLSDMEIKDLSDDNYQMASKDVYWEYDADTKTMTITGTGTYIGVTKEDQMRSGDYTTLIFGAEISELNCTEAYNSASLTTVVLLHPSDFPLKISSNFAGYNSTNSPRTWDVYTNNEAFRAIPLGSGMVINWHTLDEWGG